MVDNERPPTDLIEDNNIVAYFMLKGFKLKEWKNIEDPYRVGFEILAPAAEKSAALDKYFSNEQVGIMDYVRCFKEVKARIYSFRNLNK